jgi:hypothetical protein
MPTWRTGVRQYIEIGKCLREIESHMNHIHATVAVKDEEALVKLTLALKAANRLAREMNSLCLEVFGDRKK